MNIHAEIAFYESRATIRVNREQPVWLAEMLSDPSVVSLSRDQWSEISPIAAIETGAFAPKGGR